MGETRWTNEQLEAIKTRRCNLLVAAAAGSGKTAVLVERIIRIITNDAEPIDIDKLLVVTFTSAAASEMRERIGEAISKALEQNPNSTNLQRQLTLLSRANITTMHSFCLDVIKNHFHTIDLDPSFRIGDETEGTLMKNEIIEELFEELYEVDDEEFKELVEAYSGSKDDLKLKDIILNLYRFSMSGPWPEKWLRQKAEEFNIETLDELNHTTWIKVLKDSIQIEVVGLLNMVTKAIEIIKETEGLEPYLETFEGDLNYLQSIYDKSSGTIEELYKSLCFTDFSKLKVVRKGKADEQAQNTVKAIRDNVKKKVNGLKDDVFAFTPEESLVCLQRTYPYMRTLSRITLEFGKRFKEKKRDKNLLDFNDLEHLCLKILIEQDGEGNVKASPVAEQFREFFDEVLVDEYQDSNNVQETIINLVSRKNLDRPNVFMVGDVKQSIYRFRQAKPELFLDKYNRYPLEDGGRDRKIQLYKNFRSREEVISGVNYIFKMVMSNTVGELEYTEEEALNLGASFEENSDGGTVVGGEVELHILDKSGMTKEEDTSLEEDSEAENKEEEDVDAIALEARIVSSRIKELFEEKDGKRFRVLDKETKKYRNVKYKDIVILLRATKKWSEVFLDELGAEGIPVYADTGSGYFESIEIRTIMSLLKVIDNPFQDVPLIALLRSPIVGFNTEELSDLRLHNSKLYFYEIIDQISTGEIEASTDLKDKCYKFMERLAKWREKAIYTPIDEFIWYLYMDTAYYGYVGAMPNGTLRQANLKILFQRAKQYESTSFKGLFNFINFINKLRKSSGDMGSAKVLGENEDVVRIMSIHKSKGLEFPIVFTCGMGKQFNLMDLNNSILYHEELGFGPDFVDIYKRNSYTTLAKEAIKKRIRLETLSEEMRILYVAFTRAKEKLIITGATRDLERSINSWVNSANLEKDYVLPSEVLKGKSFLDWIGMAMCKHSNGEPLREYIAATRESVTYDLSTWNIKFWTKNMLTVDKNLEVVDEIEDQDLLIKFENETVDNEVARRLGYKYKFIEGINLPSNISVSDLKKRSYEDEEFITTVEAFKEKEPIKPKFLTEEQGLTGADRGTIVHYIMQKLELGKVNSKEQIEEQIKELIFEQSITEAEAKVISPWKILQFYKSDIGKKLIAAYESGNRVMREFPFFTYVSPLDVDPTLDISKFEGEGIRLQGIIDLFFEEEDGIVLIDYKTDFLNPGEEQVIIDRYKKQLEYYKDALQKITGKVVKEVYLYLFKLDKQVEIQYKTI